MRKTVKQYGIKTHFPLLRRGARRVGWLKYLKPCHSAKTGISYKIGYPLSKAKTFSLHLFPFSYHHSSFTFHLKKLNHKYGFPHFFLNPFIYFSSQRHPRKNTWFQNQVFLRVVWVLFFSYVWEVSFL